MKNGDLDCLFVRYDMYEGSKKTHKRPIEKEEES
jgi:hypothetical protein